MAASMRPPGAPYSPFPDFVFARFRGPKTATGPGGCGDPGGTRHADTARLPERPRGFCYYSNVIERTPTPPT